MTKKSIESSGTHENSRTLAVYIIRFDVFVPQKCCHPGVSMGLEKELLIDKDISYLCFAPTEDPTLLVGDSTTAFRDTIKGLRGEGGEDKF